jgi:undecaprenyl-phosphate 4-deoxy-4-formamido-L-arabinose transferase
MNSSLEGLSISIAMPIFNESDGIAETLTSIDEAFRDSGATVTMCIQNDVSTDNTLQVLAELSTTLQLNIAVETNKQNQGHGPTTFAAYQRALNSGSSIVMQLDSDGQFDATELPMLCSAIAEGKEVVIGIRSNRVDPWFRKFLTYLLRNFLRARYLGRFPDPNSPIRAYSASVLSPMLSELPNEPLIPNIYLSILAVRKKLNVEFVPVSHRERRGSESTGTMWQSANQWTKIARLLKFCRKSFRQLLSF